MTYEGVRMKVLKYWRVGLAKYRNKKLTRKDFTIISNNCWGGMVYESYALPKESPTVGLFFMAEDYIKFLQRLDEYLNAPLRFILPEESRYKEEQPGGEHRFGTYPIGILEIPGIGGGTERIEIFFLHYHCEEEAQEKWERRIARIHRDRLLVKFNDQNGCKIEHLIAFDKLPYQNKVCFTAKKYPEIDSAIKIRCPQKHEYIRGSYEPFGRMVTAMINSL